MQKEAIMGATNIEQLEADTTLFNLIRSKKHPIKNKLEKIKQLINESPTPNINAQDSNYNDNTPLHMAIETNELKLVDLMLAQGGNQLLKNKDNITVLEWAKQLNSSHDIIAALKRSILTLSVEITDETCNDHNHETFNDTNQGIAEKYIKEFDLDDFSQWAKIEAQKEENTFKVLKIKTASVKTALTFLQENIFIRMFNLSTHLFLIVVQVNDDILVHKDNLKQVEESTDECKPLIIQFKSSKCQLTHIFYRQPFQSIILLEQYWTQTLETDELIEKLTTCELPLILQALYFGFGGIFGGDLLKTVLNVTYEIDTWRFIDYAARSDDVLSLRYLLLFEWNLSERNMDERRILEIAAEYAGPQSMKAILDLPDTNFHTELSCFSWRKDLLSLKNTGNLTPFLIATSLGTVETLNLLIECGVIDDYKIAVQLAWNVQAYEKMISLLSVDAPFPDNFKLKDLIDNCPNEVLKEIVLDRESFHKSITDNSTDEIELFIRKTLHIKQAFNTNNQSALVTAAQAKQWDVFVFLQSKGYHIGAHEDLELTDEDKRNLKLAKPKYFRKQDNSHIIFLLSKSKLGHEGDYFNDIKELFEQLDEIPYVSTVLQVLEKSNIQEIVFDFNKDSAVDLDPMLSNSTAGSCDHVTGNLYIGAKQPSNILLGTLAHELTHFAVQTVYNNECHPYSIWDMETKKKFEEIIEQYQYSQGIDDIISRVFKNYQAVDWPAELVVRIPHILAFYYESGVTGKQQFDMLKKKVPELFEFYTEKVQKAFMEFIETPACFKNQHLNDLLQEIDKISQSNLRLKHDSIFKLQDLDHSHLILTSSIPKLAKIDLFQALEKMETRSKVKSRYIFTTIDHFKSQDIVLKIRNSFKSDLEQALIVDCTVEYDLNKETLWATISSFDKQKRTIIIADGTVANQLAKEKSKTIRLIQKEYVWCDLDAESQSNLLKKVVDFQGYSISLDSLIRSDSKFAKNIPLLLLSETRPIKIANLLSVSYGYDESYYIERTFKEESQYFSSDNVADLFKRVTHEKVLLIADGAGMGKSTILTHFSKKFKNEDPSLWIMRFDLNNHTDVLEEEKRKTKTRKWESADAINFLRLKLLKLKSTLEESVFWEMLEMKRIIIMFDGFDEISPFYNKIIVDLLAGLKQTTIRQLWITTRPHLTKDLLNKLKPIFCRLQPFTFDDQLEFLTRFWAKSISSSVTDETKIKKFALSLVKILSKSIADRDRELASVPLQAHMLAEAFHEELLEFYNSGKVNAELPQKLDILDVYKRFLHRKYLVYIFEKNSQLKINVARENLAYILSGGVNLRKIHQQLALQVLFPRQKGKLLEFHKKRSLTTEELNRIGIVQFEGDKFNFVHRTFAEYYVSDFFMNNLIKSRPISPVVVDVFLDIVLLYELHFVTRNFINSLLTSEEFKMPEANLQYFGDKINELWNKDWLKSSNDGTTILHVVIRENDINIVQFLITCLRSAGHTDTVKSFYEIEDRYGKSIWIAAIEEGHHDIVNFLWLTYREIHQNDSTQKLKSLLMSLTRNKQTCWSLAVALNLEQIFDQLINFAKEVELAPDDLIYLALHEDSYAFCIWFRAANRGQAWVFRKLFALAKNIEFQSTHYKKLLVATEDISGTVWHSTAYGNSIEVYEEIHKWVYESELKPSDLRLIVFSKNEIQETVWHCSASYNSPGVRSSMKKWRKDVNLEIVNTATETSLIEEFWKWAIQLGLTAKELKEELLQENSSGQTVWHLVVEYRDEIIADQLVNVVRRHAGIDTKEFFFELITTNYPRGSLWQIAIKSKDSFPLKMLWDWIREAQLDSEQIKQIISEKYDGKSAWHLAAMSYETDMMVSLWQYAKESRLSDSYLRSLLLERDKDGLTVWHRIIMVDDLRIFNKLLKLLGKDFSPTPSEFKDLLSEEGRCNTIWHNIFEWGRHRLLLRLLQLIDDKDLCRALILLKNSDDHNAFHLAAGSRNSHIFDSLLKWLDKAELSTDEITHQISYKDHLGQTALTRAIVAKNIKAAITLLELGADIADLNEKQCNSLKMFIQCSESSKTHLLQTIDSHLKELSRQSKYVQAEASVSTQEEELNPFDVLDF